MTVSCSNDDDKKSGDGGGSSTITFKVDGVSKTMTNVQVNEEEEDGDIYLTITGSAGATEIISFGTHPGDVGAGMAYSWDYFGNGEHYYDNGDLMSVIEVNTNKKIKGTFSGKLSHWDNDLQDYVEKTFTDGSFDISR